MQSNIQTYNIDVHAWKLRQVFDEYGIVTSYPINREQFVRDVLKASMTDKVYVYNSEGELVTLESTY